LKSTCKPNLTRTGMYT